jgi:2-keto-4-pentenoate hydratase
MTDDDIAAKLLAVHAGAPPARIEVADERQAYAVQRLVAAGLGPIGGWKVGAPGPDAAPNCAPMLTPRCSPSGRSNPKSVSPFSATC